MKINKKLDDSQVFEMILQGESNTDQEATAQLSNFELPKDWQAEHQEGQLSVDVAQTNKEVIIISTMAGAVNDKIEVYVHNDLLTIRGERWSPMEDMKELDFFHQECFWGRFSRTVVLPVDVKGDLAKAEYKNGILKILIPKEKTNKKIDVVIVDD